MDEAGRRAWLQSLVETAEAARRREAATPVEAKTLAGIEATLAAWPAVSTPSEAAAVAWLQAAHALLHHGHDCYKYALASAALHQALAEPSRS